ncbi:Filamentous haemagglutinin family outer membrane protein associated with VreARI signalling system, partial [hydrothermal vent metagenome]
TIKADDVVIAKHGDVSGEMQAVFGSDAIAIINNFSQSDKATPVLSAGGRLAIEADTITQAGVLRAPLGEISLSADSLLTLQAGSLTSTSARDQIIPFGRTSETGLDWQYDFREGDTLRVTRPSEKRILLSSADVRFNEGAVIDMSGGGDLQAWEFVSGPGGTHDVFASDTGSFAVIPTYTEYAPYDEGETKTAGFKVGDTVYLSGVGDLPAGEYALLPARYALLEGAYLVTPREGFSNITPGTNNYLLDKTPVVAGQYRLAATGVHDQFWNGFAVETSTQARRRAEMILTSANQYYTDKALADETLIPLLPQDAGQLSISALSRLDLAGELRSAAEGDGRGGRLDIEATNLAIVSQRSASGVNDVRVELLVEELNQLDMESLLLGGVRRQTDAGTEITVTTQMLTVETNSNDSDDTLNLSGTEILLAAQDRIDLNRGVTVRAEGEGGLGADTLIVNGDGALVRVSAGKQVSVSRIGSSGKQGTININEGALLDASSAMLLDASYETTINGKLETNNGSLNIGAERINLGNVSISATGLVLNRDLLDSLSLSELVMTSRKGIYVYGNVDFTFDNVVFDGAGIVSQGNGSNHFTVNADKLRFTNSTAGVDLASVSEDAFSVNAREIEFGKGDYMLAGFDTVNMNASEQIIGTGESNVTIKADIQLNTPLISSGNGANTNIDAAGYQFAISRLETEESLAAAGIGGHLSINAETIRNQGTILLPSGVLELNATQGLYIDDALIDVSGVSKSFRGEVKTAPGGKVILTSEQANVELTQSAHIDLSAADGGDAGTLKVDTAQGEFIWDGTISATAANGDGGRFDLNAQSMSDVFAVLNNKLLSAGFDESVSLRLGQGDIDVVAADTLKAHNLTLTADTGNVTINGLIDARGDNGGRVNLSAGDNVDVSGRIDASATTDEGDGGAVQLATIDSDNDGVGEINVNGEIDVSAGANGKGGDVGYRARRIDSNNDGQDDEIAIVNAGTVIGAAAVNYEAVRIYEDVNRITQTQLNQWQGDTQGYMNFADAIEARLNGNGGVNGRILPGLEIRSSGDMRIDTEIDFASWRYGGDGTPGVFTLLAEGDLLINKDISDGFEDGFIVSSYGAFPLANKLMMDESWSYRLVAGSNRKSANVMDVNMGTGNIKLANNTKVRTGTGFIDIASGNNLELSNDASVIYTAGRATEEDRRGELTNEIATGIFYAEYPINGGDIRIATGGDFQGAVSDQSLRDWLMSTGSWSRDEDHLGEMPTSWGLALTQTGTNLTGDPAISVFRRSIGALGGGDVNIDVVGDMQDVSVMMPTSGKPLGEHLSLDPLALDFSENRVEISGGGLLNVNTGGNINGGMFYLGKGEGNIRAEGGLLAGTNDIRPVFAMGDTQLNIVSKNELGIGAVFDPLIEQPTFNSAGNTYFFTYSDTSSLTLNSVSGDIHFYNDGNENEAIYPASLSASSLAGDIVIDEGFTLFPSVTGQLELLAANNIFATPGEAQIFMSDADPALVPNIDHPVTVDDLNFYQQFNPSGEADLIHAKTPLHIDDDVPVRIVAESGSISSPGSLWINVPKKAEVYAGRDIRNSNFIIQNINKDDRSRITAGRDFSYKIPRLFDGGVQSKVQKLQVAGPGQLILQAGRNIDLGTSVGIETIGNIKNPVLADNGADVIVIAGVKDNMDYAGFAETYVNQTDKYLAAVKTFIDNGVVDFDQDVASSASSAELESGREKFAGLDEQKQQAFLRELFLREIRDVGVKNAEEGSSDYQPAYDAIANLFPGSYEGNINLFFSKIHTIDGGNIQLLTPGGGVNAGLASSKGLSKKPSDLGIVAQREGKIDAFVRDDFEVNLSRVFTLAGGDIMIFSHQGDIDAGRGAKSAMAAPPVKQSFDEDGNLIVELPPLLQGSGIRTVASGDGEAGDVYLFAPQGVIDAGDAGIDSAGGFWGDAPLIIGGDNISVGGVSVGVPTASASLAAGLTGVSNLSASSSKMAEESTSSIGKTSEEAGFADTPMGFLNIELLGFGGGVTSTTAPSINTSSKIKF